MLLKKDPHQLLIPQSPLRNGQLRNHGVSNRIRRSAAGQQTQTAEKVQKKHASLGPKNTRSARKRQASRAKPTRRKSRDVSGPSSVETTAATPDNDAYPSSPQYTSDSMATEEDAQAGVNGENGGGKIARMGSTDQVERRASCELIGYTKPGRRSGKPAESPHDKSLPVQQPICTASTGKPCGHS